MGRLKKSVKPEEHQLRVVDKLTKEPGVLVYHGLGSGKTLTSIMASLGTPTDVVVPASLRENYKKEVRKHTENHDPNVISYEGFTKGLAKALGGSLIVDEAHMLGDASTKRTSAIADQAPKYSKRILLTGTPIRNKPSELAPLVNIIKGKKTLPTDEKAFAEKYISEEVVDPGFYNRFIRGIKPGVRHTIKNEDDLRTILQGSVDYHAPPKEDFPSSTHEVIHVPMSDEQLKYYKFLLGKADRSLRAKIKEGLPPSKTEAKSLNSFLSGVRQVANSTKAFGGSGDSTKINKALDSLKSRMQNDKNFKALVYSNFLDSGVKSYAEKLDSSGIPYAVFDGSLSDKKRKQIVEGFNKGDSKVLLVSGAGTQGLDLKGTKLVQLLEPHWNNPRLDQATGRAIRYKSHGHLPENERHVHVQKFISTVPKTFVQKLFNKKEDTSVDQYLEMLAKDKEKLNAQFLRILRDVGSQK